MPLTVLKGAPYKADQPMGGLVKPLSRATADDPMVNTAHHMPCLVFAIILESSSRLGRRRVSTSRGPTLSNFVNFGGKFSTSFRLHRRLSGAALGLELININSQ
jgi:hypothetical protein